MDSVGAPAHAWPMTSWERAKLVNEKAATLAGEGKPADAVRAIEAELPLLDPMDRTAILAPLVKWANEAGLRDEAIKYCRELMKTDPEMPLVKRTREMWSF